MTIARSLVIFDVEGTLVDSAALAMGGFGGYPPLLAAWAPFVLFFLLGETVLIRTEE